MKEAKREIRRRMTIVGIDQPGRDGVMGRKGKGRVGGTISTNHLADLEGVPSMYCYPNPNPSRCHR